MPEATYPFTAIVGQQLMKKAVLLAVINPALSPILLRGFRGTAKSTIVNSLSDLVPDIEVNKGCIYNCSPSEPDLFCVDCRSRAALGTLESRIQPMPVIKLSAYPLLLAKKFKTIESWAEDYRIIASANRGILIAEKINIYDERLADSLLTLGAKGFRSAAGAKTSNFTLIATMNVEDGEISPTLLERFTLQVNVTDISDIEERIEITKRAAEYRKNSASFWMKFVTETDKMKKKIVKSQEDLNKIENPQKVKDSIFALCKKYKIKGMEDIIERTAMTNAAYEGKRYISLDDVKEILDITVAHRL